MILCIENVLLPHDVTELRAQLDRLAFEDGRVTAGFAAAAVKRNMQAVSDPAVDAWRARIAAAVTANVVFALAARPKRIIGPLLSRYRPGDTYGRHVDEAILDGSRADLAFTLFLDAPDSYDGGDLVIETTSGNDTYKLAAGSLVLYPATTLHHVAPVTRGLRHAAVGWVHSHVRRADQREVLFDLDTAYRRLFAAQGTSEELDLIGKSVANLLRQWAD